MAYRIRTESFEGPFDLLLYLVNRQRIDIGSVNISEIANQYLDEVERMKRLDLDVASDFLVVAATLLEIKAASLVEADDEDDDDEFDGIGASEAREVLYGRLIDYKKYKNAAAGLNDRMLEHGKMHARHFGAPSEFLHLMPDYLANVTLEDLAKRYVSCYTRRDAFLLESEHIASKPIAVEKYVTGLLDRIRVQKRFRFSEIAPAGSSTDVIVVSFLAILELLKRNMVTVWQDGPFGDIEIDYVEGSGVIDPADPVDEYGEVS